MKMEIDDESTLPRYSDLLSAPGSLEFSGKINRMEGSGEVEDLEGSDLSSVRQSRQFSRQYAHTYFVRLSTFRPILEERVGQQWAGIPMKRISALCETSSTISYKQSPRKNAQGHGPSAQDQQHGQHIALREDITVAILGTIFKQQPLKPSILQELGEEIQITDRSVKQNYVSDKDVILLEDETTRVRLIPGAGSGLTINGLVNGLVCAVKGKPTIDGKFEVQAVIWATPKPSIWPQRNNCDRAEMVFVSGLHFGLDSDQSVQLGMLFEHLEGLSGSSFEQEEVTGKRTKVFFLGNSIHIEDSGTDRFKKTAEVSSKLDQLFSQLAKTMEVFVLSGKADPVEAMYPQPPLHSCLFPQSTQYPNFHLLSNPSHIQIPISSTRKANTSIDMILTDGEPIQDTLRFSDIPSPLQAGQKFLEWGHICPTAPDTLPLHPGVPKDIFILKNSLPHLFVIGNQKKFGVLEWKGTKIVSVPQFSTTKTAVIFTKDFDCIPLEFDVLVENL